ncbi:hypothetical protein M404DRAFT_540428 [Pisolithus tinctorius Marx 270]|uniref:Uncharacterized protein n=1 Tax=Pisolithus tinctorius Marx 270 TaxID=870435 RepID=A0A0C3PA83_PISTI|nr:hypothetical protein M404DRAFT_540428 [Pisolithus tinctorius Marx 270]
MLWNVSPIKLSATIGLFPCHDCDSATVVDHIRHFTVTFANRPSLRPYDATTSNHLPILSLRKPHEPKSNKSTMGSGPHDGSWPSGALVT